MKKFLVIFLFALSQISAQELSCEYFLNGDIYQCLLSINNPDGFNNFTTIGGIHLEGLNNANVTYITRLNGTSTNVPSILCETFPNTENFNFFSMGVTEVASDAFSGCSRLSFLRLWSNRITTIAEDAFVNNRNLIYIDLDENLFNTLPANLFANQQNLESLEVAGNPFHELPATIFNSLTSLNYLAMYNSNLSNINPLWFTNTQNLRYLYLQRNRLENVQDNWFVNLGNLWNLNLGQNGIANLTNNVFRSLTNLTTLYFNNNRLTELRAGFFSGLNNLRYLELNSNPISNIQEGAFEGLPVVSIDLASCNLVNLLPNTFAGLPNLEFLYLYNNLIEELPAGIFSEINPTLIGLWRNELKVVRRNLFGDLSNLSVLDLESNFVNALDRQLIDDAVNLDTLYFNNNLCASEWLGSFRLNRAQHLERLSRCFRNFRYIVETTTEADAPASFYEAPDQGIAFRVNADSEIRISLTPFDFEWNPMLEIIIGSNNNTRSSIRRNQETTNVVIIPTPGILGSNQWNDFRITWANQVLLVFRDNEQFPFMGFTMTDFFPVGFYGFRSIGSRASWTANPFDW